MNDQAKDQLRELNWRRPLTEAEQAQLRGWLETDPEERADWEAEARLTEGLSQLSDALSRAILGARSRGCRAGRGGQLSAASPCANQLVAALGPSNSFRGISWGCGVLFVSAVS